MIRNYLLVAFRTMLRNKFFSAINALGLALGLAGFWIIMQYVTFERSYDNFHVNADNIYRVQLDQYKNNELIFKSSENYPAVGPALEKDFPEIVSNARLYNLGSKNNVVITYQDAPGGPIQFKHRRFLYADSSFLPMFSYKMIYGDAATALSEPFSMVISESYAKKYFGETNPLGKFLRMRDDDFNDELCKVTGVVQDSPDNTHLKFDVLISYKTLYTRFEKARFRYDQTWARKDMYTYILVQPGTDVAALQSKFPDFIKKHNPDLEKQFRRDELSLQPLRDIHLYSRLTDEAEPNGNGNSVYFLTIIAVFIIIIAWINYVNLATARSMDRAKEVGVRKVMGAEKNRLMLQFLVESFLINFIAMLLSFLIVFSVWPPFKELTGIPIDFILWKEIWFTGLALLIFSAGSFLSGIYPALVLSGFEPVTVLKGKFKNSSRGVWLRKSLVVAQFAASAALIVGTLTVYQQLEHMRNADLGMNIEQTLVVERPGVVETRKGRVDATQTFKETLKQNASVKGVTSSVVVPGKKLRFKADVRQLAQPENTAVPVAYATMDYDFIQTFGMKLIAGRNFSAAFPQDPDTSVILTESTARMLGFTTPGYAIGKTLAIDAFKYYPIVAGVVADYHHESLELETQPTMFACDVSNPEYFMIKVAPDNIMGTIEFVHQTWDQIFPGNPFDYFFLDDYFNQQYKADQTFGKVFGLFALLAIIVGCLGLFGLSSFTISQRIKEIAIRKICGASLPRLLVHLGKDFVFLVAVASVIAWPVMYWVMTEWLARFASRIAIGWEVFAVSGLLMLLIALLTVSYQTIKAALTNPVTCLRYE